MTNNNRHQNHHPPSIPLQTRISTGLTTQMRREPLVYSILFSIFFTLLIIIHRYYTNDSDEWQGQLVITHLISLSFEQSKPEWTANKHWYIVYTHNLVDMKYIYIRLPMLSSKMLQAGYGNNIFILRWTESGCFLVVYCWECIWLVVA